MSKAVSSAIAFEWDEFICNFIIWQTLGSVCNLPLRLKIVDFIDLRLNRCHLKLDFMVISNCSSIIL
jgi:hypothetical protein